MKAGKSLRFMDSMTNAAGNTVTQMSGSVSPNYSTFCPSLQLSKINFSVFTADFLPASKLLTISEP